eukprot:7389850-Prymnesium_polylepis.1
MSGPPAATPEPSVFARAMHASAVACPVGKAHPVPGRSNESVCTPCRPGSFATATGTTNCP